MKFKFLIKCFTIIFFILSSSANAGFITDRTGELLLGFEKIEISNKLYNVSFLAGTCETVFSGCDQSTDFLWQTAEQAMAASNALLDIVFIGSYDTIPSKTNGCEARTHCQVSTPFGIKTIGNVQVSWVNNYHTFNNAGVSATWAGWSSSQDFRDISHRTYAKWTEVEAPSKLPLQMLPLSAMQPGSNSIKVPEPLSVSLFMFAFIALFAFRFIK